MRIEKNERNKVIASIQGKIIQKGVDYLIVNLNGLGIQVFSTKETCETANIGDIKFFHSQLIVREESLTLFGFESEIEREYFNLLLGVNGVGTRLALSIISTLSIDAINRAVASDQFEIFSRVPGVGKKTAQKIAIHLQGKINVDADIIGLKSSYQDVDLEVLEALTTLGYSLVEAQSALQFIPKDAPKDIEERLRIALQYFS
ncbi:MAG: Holliday junction branch migration protein RuvA [Chloroflexi bacterium HGW-Chloroflexi-3]|nr:MAG: Holliday junction branch migration protein RuvA [Chloroflexi bacterium HGW-Chloroflexi-3]